VDLDDSAIIESIFKVRVFTHRFEKTLEYTGLGPPTKLPKPAVPITKGRWQIAHGKPVRIRQKTTSRNSRLSFAVAPASLTLPGKCHLSRCHKTSDTTNRCSFIQTSILQVRSRN
jgi:hypothetical protein